MSAISSVTSISIHAAVGAALLLGSTKSGRSTPTARPDFVIEFPRTPQPVAQMGDGLGVPTTDQPVLRDLGSIPIPSGMLQRETLETPGFSTEWSPTPGTRSGQPGGEGVWSGEAAPEVLAGPLPAYPELLRQAGVEGQVVLEAVVDSSGRVQRASVAVVSATHAGFVEPARQALIATLFRPARVNGRAVATLVRVPFGFSIRSGTGRAR
jgi:protein TonB